MELITHMKKSEFFYSKWEKWSTAFLASRSRNHIILEAELKELSNDLNIKQRGQIKKIKWTFFLKEKSIKIYIKKAYIALKKSRLIIKIIKNNSNTIYVYEENRIPVSSSRFNLKRITQPSQDNIKKIYHDDPLQYIIHIDPILFTEEHIISENDNFINLDYISLFVIGIILSLKINDRRDFLISIKYLMKGNTYAFSSIFIAKIIEVILRNSSIKKIYLLTSNSKLPEIIRWSGCELNSIEEIIEVFHGVPTLELYEYHNICHTIFNNHEKCKFILPNNKIKISSTFRIDDSFGYINLTSNSWNMRNLKDKNNHQTNAKKAELKKEYDLVISLNGSHHKDVDIGTSINTKIEVSILKIINEISKRERLNIKIFYTFHPVRDTDTNRKIISNLIPNIDLSLVSRESWEVSDICIAINSSSLWDSITFGAIAASPLRHNQKMYPEHTFNNIFHRKESESIKEMLERLITISLENSNCK